MTEVSDQKTTSLGKRSSTGDSDNENERYLDEKGNEPELAGQSMSAEALRRLRRRISNRESARRLRKQRNEKLNSLLSQQDNLQGINDCLKAQISAAREELLRLTDENRGMLMQLGELDSLPALEAASRPIAETETVVKRCRSDRHVMGNGMASVNVSEAPSPASSGGLMPAPPPRAIEASTGASCSDLPQACSMQTRDNPDSTSDSAAPSFAPQAGSAQASALRSASSAQQSVQPTPAATMMTRSSHRAHSTTPKVDMRIAIQELTNVKANAAAGSAAATAAAKAAAAAAAATNPTISSAGHSVPETMTSGFLERPQALDAALGVAGAMQPASLGQPWAHQPVD